MIDAVEKRRTTATSWTAALALLSAAGIAAQEPTAKKAQAKSAICHVPAGNPAAAHTLRLPEPAIRAHLKHGDTLGECPTTATKTDAEPDVRDADPQEGRKVAICHIPPGNPGAAHTLQLPAAAIPAHLGHGDRTGACEANGKGDSQG
jgi:hypothetical protein